MVAPGDNAFLNDSKVKLLTYDVWYIQIPVVPQKAVAEVSRIGNL